MTKKRKVSRGPAAPQAVERTRGEVHRVGDLEIEEDLDHQRRCWKLERASWAVMALVLLAAMAGLFGSGPLSWATVVH